MFVSWFFFCRGAMRLDTCFSPALHSDTGLDSQITQPSLPITTHIDFFQGTCKFSSLESFHNAVDYVFRFSNSEELIFYLPGVPLFSGVHWENSVKSSAPGRVAYTQLPDGVVWAWFSLPGAFFHRLSIVDQHRFLLGLFHCYEFRCNRIDLKIRDYLNRITPSELLQYAEAGNLHLVRKYEGCLEGFVGSAPTFTVYLGSKASDKFVRVYHAGNKHGIDATDWELQARDEKARVLFESLTNCEISTPEGDYDSQGTYQAFAQLLGGFVVGAVDFLEGDSKNLSRLVRMSFYQSLVDDVSACIRAPSGQVSTTLQQKLDWLEKAVFPILSALRDGFTKARFRTWLDSRLDAAKSRFTETHEIITFQAKSFAASNFSSVDVFDGSVLI